MRRSLSLLLWLLVPAVSAQTPAAVSSEDHALIQQLLTRVHELEQEVKE